MNFTDYFTANSSQRHNGSITKVSQNGSLDSLINISILAGIHIARTRYGYGHSKQVISVNRLNIGGTN